MSETQSAVLDKPDAFAFGKNWQNFLDSHLTDERLEEAKASLIKFVGEENIKGKTFLAIGCGSGLFSLAAHLLGASRIHSFDVDRDSVHCCEVIKERFGISDDTWTVGYGSALDKDFLAGLGSFDVVYSWGVLHHTGDMWTAIDNASQSVASGGHLYIAIYNKSDGFCFYPDGRLGNSKLWEIEKKIYHSLPGFFQSMIDWFAMIAMVLIYLLTFNNPVQKIKEHKQLRGMSWSIDIKDWLGGYPYEYATTEEIFKFLKPKGFSLENLISHNGLRCNEFLFCKN